MLAGWKICIRWKSGRPEQPAAALEKRNQKISGIQLERPQDDDPAGVLYQGAETLTHRCLKVLKRRTGLTTSR
ncbi:hypothetical protein [Pannonibacter phragmitetus]|uniref:Uncharacterized protein n=1 Tax=Pannonibacter phragmitetus TaxID=121719 RepID=A0A0U2W6I2_9HYPH|nr:hypothetical protein [Pannonibacter phragmitetus]ALV28074.1 hypothetical protein APZ00_14230 [Pannonibacter phragmitetus]